MAVHLHLVAMQICGTNSYWDEQERRSVDWNYSVKTLPQSNTWSVGQHSLPEVTSLEIQTFSQYRDLDADYNT